MVEAYTRLEDYESLERVIDEIPENSPLLIDLGDKVIFKIYVLN